MIKDKEFEFAGKQESKWIDIRDKTQKIIEDLETNLEINREILKFANQKIKESAI